MKFKFDSNIPIYIQLVDELKKNIISGNVEPGSRLPSVRELALEMKVNPNTMQKALVELENLGLVYTERTNGKYVTQNKALIEKFRDFYAKELLNSYLDNMKSIGFSKSESIKYLKEKGGEK